MDIYINPVTNDIEFLPDGDLRMVDGVELVRQRIDMRLNMLYGEWTFNTEKYVDWYGTVIGKLAPGHLLAVDEHYRSIIEGVEGVKQITSFTSTVTGRVYSAVVTLESETEETLVANITPVEFDPDTFGPPQGSAASFLQNTNVMIMGAC